MISCLPILSQWNIDVWPLASSVRDSSYHPVGGATNKGGVGGRRHGGGGGRAGGEVQETTRMDMERQYSFGLEYRSGIDSVWTGINFPRPDMTYEVRLQPF